jgi:hypothetical protein
MRELQASIETPLLAARTWRLLVKTNQSTPNEGKLVVIWSLERIDTWHFYICL